MIRPLRQWHRRIFLTLGIVLPVTFAVGIVARKPVKGMNSLPGELLPSSQVFAATEWERADLFAKTSIQVRLLRESRGKGQFAAAFSTSKDFVKPDLMVYWVSGSVQLADVLPENARLLGVFDPTRALPLPAEAETIDGTLVLYSLADHELVETSKPFSTR